MRTLGALERYKLRETHYHRRAERIEKNEDGLTVIHQLINCFRRTVVVDFLNFKFSQVRPPELLKFYHALRQNNNKLHDPITHQACNKETNDVRFQGSTTTQWRCTREKRFIQHALRTSRARFDFHFNTLDAEFYVRRQTLTGSTSLPARRGVWSTQSLSQSSASTPLTLPWST